MLFRSLPKTQHPRKRWHLPTPTPRPQRYPKHYCQTLPMQSLPESLAQPVPTRSAPVQMVFRTSTSHFCGPARTPSALLGPTAAPDGLGRKPAKPKLPTSSITPSCQTHEMTGKTLEPCEPTVSTHKNSSRSKPVNLRSNVAVSMSSNSGLVGRTRSPMLLLKLFWVSKRTTLEQKRLSETSFLSCHQRQSSVMVAQ